MWIKYVDENLITTTGLGTDYHAYNNSFRMDKLILDKNEVTIRRTPGDPKSGYFVRTGSIEILCPTQKVLFTYVV